jgi:hypothetical protein
MPALIFIIAAIAFWIHAERNLSLSKRVIGGIIFWGSCLLFVHFGHSVGTNYEKTYVARTLKNVAAEASAESREDYLRLAEAYENRRISGGQLMLESNEILSRVNTKKAEQAGTGQPATCSESKSEGSFKPQPEAEGRSR